MTFYSTVVKFGGEFADGFERVEIKFATVHLFVERLVNDVISR